MTAKEYLLEIRKHKRILDSLDRKAEDLRTQAEGLKAIVYDKDRVQVSPSNQLEKIMPALIEAQNAYAKQLWRYNMLVLKRTQQIANMEREDYAEVLRLRYLETGTDGHKLTWEEIATMTHRSSDWVRHMHGDALQAFEKQYHIGKDDTQQHKTM